MILSCEAIGHIYKAKVAMSVRRSLMRIPILMHTIMRVKTSMRRRSNGRRYKQRLRRRMKWIGAIVPTSRDSLSQTKLVL